MRSHEVQGVPSAIIASLATPWGASHRRRRPGLASRLAARPHRDGRRPPRHRGERGARRPRLPPRDPGSRRPLAAEHVPRRQAVLARHPDGRDGPRSCSSIWPGARRSRDDDFASSGRWSAARPVPGAQRPGHAAGPLGGGGRLSAFTLAVEIAALLAAADLADIGRRGRGGRPTCARPPTPGTRTSKGGSTSGHRPGPAGRRRRLLRAHREPGQARRPTPAARRTIKNRPPGRVERGDVMVSPDALALVRFGLRAADDPRIVNTVRVIDRD